jgi:lambda family phage portal protein
MSGKIGYTQIDVTPETVVPTTDSRTLPRLKVKNVGQGPSGNSHGRGYEGAIRDQWNRDWLTSHMSGDLAVGTAWENITQRARDLVRNEPWAKQAIERIVGNVCGPEGILTESEIELNDGTLDDEAGGQIDNLFTRWAMEEADAEGELALPEIQSVSLSEAPEVGETFLVEVNDPDRNRIIPLCYQILEAEQINSTMDGMSAEGNRIKRGIEFDRRGRRVAYHFWTQHPYDLVLSAQDTVRVPAERIIHYYEKSRPSQTRGITWFASILQSMRDLGQYVGNEMKAARIGSLFTVAVKRAAGVGTGIGFGDDAGDGYDGDSNPLEYLGPGIIADIGQGDSVEMIESKRPASGAEPWIKLILSTMANGIGLSYLGLTRDTKESSFSAARFAQQGDKLFYKALQGKFGRRCPLRIRQRAVAQMIAMGRISSISPDQFRKNRQLFLGTRILPPGWEEIQVGEEVKAAVERIRAGFSTLQEECAGRGKNYRRILKQRARELALIRELELDLSTNYPGNVNSAGPVTEQPEDEPVEQEKPDGVEKTKNA